MSSSFPHPLLSLSRRAQITHLIRTPTRLVGRAVTEGVAFTVVWGGQHKLTRRWLCFAGHEAEQLKEKVAVRHKEELTSLPPGVDVGGDDDDDDDEDGGKA